MKKILLLLCVLNISACGSPNINTDKEYILPNQIDSSTKLSLGSFQIFDVKENYKNIVIDKVLLSDSNKRIDDSGDTELIPDYYLKWLHKLSIISEKNKRTDTLIKIGEPIKPNTSLSPSISEINIIKKDIKGGVFQVLSDKDDNDHDDKDFDNYKPDTPINIKIKGKNFPMFYKFSYSTIDSKFGFGHSTAISKDVNGNIVWESIIHIPNPKEFENKTSHTLTYSTPFGTAIKRF